MFQFQHKTFPGADDLENVCHRTYKLKQEKQDLVHVSNIFYDFL